MSEAIQKQMILDGIDRLREYVNEIYSEESVKPHSFEEFYNKYQQIRNKDMYRNMNEKEFAPNECRSCGKPSYGNKFCADCEAMGWFARSQKRVEK